ncbi:MAG: hypothetical protein U1E97_02660 [Alphaproteobacteria bacterium]
MTDDAATHPALVGFHDFGQFFGCGLLRRGFRHTLVAINDGRAWLVIDPRLDRIAIDASLPASFDLASAWHSAGITVVLTAAGPLRRPFRPVALAPLTCVEVVKRVLGVRRARILTPFGLYRHLIGSLQNGSLVQPFDTSVTATPIAAIRHNRRPRRDRTAAASASCGGDAARPGGQHPDLGAW